MAPAASPKVVINSAALVKGRRNSALKTLSMADTNVPACEIPIQNTKVTINTPQKTGRRIPATPIPVAIIYPQAPNNKTATPNPNPITKTHHLRVVVVMASMTMLFNSSRGLGSSMRCSSCRWASSSCSAGRAASNIRVAAAIGATSL